MVLLAAIDPFVAPHMPGSGRKTLWAAIPLSHHLLDGGWWQYVLFGLIALPWLALLLALPLLPGWLRRQREWERKAALRRQRERARRARKRAERDEPARTGETDAAQQS